MTAAVDGFLKRVAADKRINGRFVNVDMPRLRGFLIEFISSATGGHVEYHGREMGPAHAGLQIVAEEFDAIVEDLVGALDELKVPNPEKQEILGALGPLKPQIVNPPPASEAAHDPALAEAAKGLVATLRGEGATKPADLLELATTARLRGQRSYAEQLFSTVEGMVPQGRLDSVALLFREGGPERITSKLTQMPLDSPPQPKGAVGDSDEDVPDDKPARASLSGKLRIDGGPEDLGVVALDAVGRRHPRRTPKQRTMEQRERAFAPHVLAVPVGSTVAFPNFDPIFHNVFSLSPSRSFDLGIYRNGESREITFPKEGLVRLGCNLHANMAAYVVVVAAAHYAVTKVGGAFSFRNLAPGKYKLRAWSESRPEPVTRTITVKPGDNFVTVAVPRGNATRLGTDKFGVPRGDKH